jgi:uncharacterized protein (DUF433 family)
MVLGREVNMSAITTPHIEVSPGVAGGKPRIAGHRITVHNIVVWHERLGLSADEIASNSGLELADVYAALTYYYDHRQEIDESILADESYAAEMRNRAKTKLSGTAK